MLSGQLFSFLVAVLRLLGLLMGTIFVCSYEKERKLRVAIIHGLARMAAIMATTYRPYLGTGLGPLSVRQEPHSFVLLSTF